MDDLVLSAYGGAVREGEECYLFDTSRFLTRRIAAARLVQIGRSDVGLLVDNRVYKCYEVASTEREAKAQLLLTANNIVSIRNERLDLARAFIESQDPAGVSQ